MLFGLICYFERCKDGTQNVARESERLPRTKKWIPLKEFVKFWMDEKGSLWRKEAKNSGKIFSNSLLANSRYFFSSSNKVWGIPPKQRGSHHQDELGGLDQRLTPAGQPVERTAMTHRARDHVDFFRKSPFPPSLWLLSAWVGATCYQNPANSRWVGVCHDVIG